MGIFDQLERDPNADIPGFGSAPISCLRLCRIRDECLRQAGFRDIYKAVKVEGEGSVAEIASRSVLCVRRASSQPP